MESNFYDSYFLVKPVQATSPDDMLFQFEAKIIDQALIKILIPQQKKNIDSVDYLNKQNTLNDTQKTWMSGPGSSHV